MICRVLPNRQIVLLMTPREASMLGDQILDPADFPWQDSESQVVALTAKSQLHSAVRDMASNELDKSIGAVLGLAEAERRQQEEREEVVEEEQPPEQAVQLQKEGDGSTQKGSLLHRVLEGIRSSMGPVGEDAYGASDAAGRH